MEKFISGKYIQQKEYKSFLPNLINREFVFSDNSIAILLEEANKYLGELNGYSSLIPDINSFVKMHIIKESTSSNNIEGTKTRVSDAVLPANEIAIEERDDWHEVHNYLKSLNFAIKQLKKMPLSLRLIKSAHKILLAGVRGNYKLPGEVRKSQNWIGGSNLKNARFVPPNANDLPELLSDWEKFWHNKNLQIPVLIKVAICHYQFETIHPFLDGNGRMGRLIMILQLIEKNILNYPILYLSSYLNANRNDYYAALESTRINNDLEGWIKFILEGIIESSKNSTQILNNIAVLRDKYEDKIAKLGRRENTALRILMCFFSQPVLGPKDIVKKLGISFNTANSIMLELEKMDIVKQKERVSRNRLFVLKEYLDLFNE